MDKIVEISSENILQKISQLLVQARQKVANVVNFTMVHTYFEIGRMIVEEEQNGAKVADYGSYLLDNLSNKLTNKFGKGFSVTNLRQMRRFYLSYRNEVNEYLQKRQTLSAESDSPYFQLSWSHYVKLIQISDPLERKFYEVESVKNNWSLRELNRQYDSALFTRLALSKDKKEIRKLSEQGQVIESPRDLIKDPYVLEFLDLPEKSQYSENELEQALIDKLEHFLLELGTGFTFVARQKRITFDEQHFFIDLVFYNRLLKSFVLIDLKLGKLKHQDIGQMQMYVNYYDRKMRLPDENKTIGIILCQNKSESLVEFTLPEDNEQIFASKYLTALPTKEQLLNLIQDI